MKLSEKIKKEILTEESYRFFGKNASNIDLVEWLKQAEELEKKVDNNVRIVVFKDGTYVRTESDLEAKEHENNPDWLVSISEFN